MSSRYPKHNMATVEVGSSVTGAGAEDLDEGAVSPRHHQPSPMTTQAVQSLGSMNNGLSSLDLRADPDAQATVTDFLDFTEYLPADMMRSLTLIGGLDQTYIDASTEVHNLTMTWGQLPSMAPEERPAPVQLRARISENLNRALSSRVYSHSEAVRMAENVKRHYNRAKTILAKLQTMMENYPPPEEQKSPVAPKSPQMIRTPKAGAQGEAGQQRLRRPRVPRITVPGEVLAPYDINYETYSEESELSSSSEEEESPAPRSTPAPQPRIKIVKTPKIPKIKAPKPVRTPARPPGSTVPHISTSTALAQLKPPPENAVAGSVDAPWLQLTAYELAKLRKRMKKNAQWTPSETMIARELKLLNRGYEAYKEAKKKAEEEGRPFDDALPAMVVDPDGVERPPLGALSLDAAMAAEGKHNTNRGMRLNEAKKLKKESDLSQLAAQEAEESTRKMLEAARAIFAPIPPLEPATATAAAAVAIANTGNNGKAEPGTHSKAASRQPRKRKRDAAAEQEAERAEASETPSQRQQLKRTKTETPVPIPQPVSSTAPVPAHETPVPPPSIGRPPSMTPVPPDAAVREPSAAAAPKSPPVHTPITAPASTSTSPLSTMTATSGPSTFAATIIPAKPPAEVPVLPPQSPKKSTTPIHPPVRELRTRDATKKEQQQQQQQLPPRENQASPSAKPPSRAPTPGPSWAAPAGTSVSTPAGSTAELPRRPQSRGKAMSQEPQPSLAADRPRRASTARNTPAPESRQPSKRVKRPAPGVISRTNSGGNSAVGRRKAAPKKKRGAHKKVQAEVEIEVEGEVEVDDEGNVIDADEPRYCLCNRVSFGTMIQCDNIDSCKLEWFHLECVDLTDIPARTTKWYCPECRVLLNIGEKGEVSARGVRM